jgi:hypothetical protein
MAAIAAQFLVPISAGFAQGRTVSRIVVDTRPLEARGGRGAAAILRAQLQASLQREFAGSIGRGPELVARVNSVLLSSGEGGGDDSGSVHSDYLEGEIVIGKERIPILVTVSSDTAGAWYLPDIEQRRLRALADSFASWARRRV